MESKLSNECGDSPRRRHLATTIRQSLRELRNQLSSLNRQVGTRVDLKDVDLDCFDFIAQHGPVSPSILAQRANLHPATVTGILDRLERSGWVARDRTSPDRRAVVIRALHNRTAELVCLYAGMNAAMNQICAEYGDAELELITDFLRRTIDAGRNATDKLADE
jgi:DNA-binding MarR family transcriptional regulator